MLVCMNVSLQNLLTFYLKHLQTLQHVCLCISYLVHVPRSTAVRVRLTLTGYQSIIFRNTIILNRFLIQQNIIIKYESFSNSTKDYHMNECIHVCIYRCMYSTYVCVYACISVYICMHACMYIYISVYSVYLCLYILCVYRYPLFVDEVRLLQFCLLHRPRREEGQRAVGRADSEIRHPQNAIPGRVRSWVYGCMYVCMYVYVCIY